MDGWTLLFKTVERDIQTKSDVLIAFVHWQLLHAGMKCLGLGDDKTLSHLDEETEILPDGWNMNKDSYSLRYKYDDVVFVFIGTVADDNSIMLNLVNGKSLEVSNAAFVLDPTVVSLKGKLSTLMPKFEYVIKRLQHELFDPVFSAKKEIPETQTSQLLQPNPFNNWMHQQPLNSPREQSWPSSDFFGRPMQLPNMSFRPVNFGANFRTQSNFLPQEWPPVKQPRLRDSFFLPGTQPGAQIGAFHPLGLSGNIPPAGPATAYIPSYLRASLSVDSQWRNSLALLGDMISGSAAPPRANEQRNTPVLPEETPSDVHAQRRNRLP